MKIAVVGCGAVGSYYGARLWRSGHDVHFLLRSDLDAVRARGVRILSPDGDFLARPGTAGRPAEIGVSDLVVVALKTTANAQFGRLLPPLVGPGTWVLTLQNGLGNEEDLAACAGSERILGGLCFVCLNRIAPGVIRHLAHGSVVLGQHRAEPSAFAADVAAEFRRAGVACSLAADLERAHWEKLLWNIPFNGLGVAGVVGHANVVAGIVPERLPRCETLPTDELLADPRWCALLRVLMDEVRAGAGGQGFAIGAELAEEMIARTRTMGAYKASTLLDFERGLPLEVDRLFREPLRRATLSGVSTPMLVRLTAVLAGLNRRQRLLARSGEDLGELSRAASRSSTLGGGTPGPTGDTPRRSEVKPR